MLSTLDGIMITMITTNLSLSESNNDNLLLSVF